MRPLLQLLLMTVALLACRREAEPPPATGTPLGPVTRPPGVSQAAFDQYLAALRADQPTQTDSTVAQQRPFGPAQSPVKLRDVYVNGTLHASYTYLPTGQLAEVIRRYYAPNQDHLLSRARYSYLDNRLSTVTYEQSAESPALEVMPMRWVTRDTFLLNQAQRVSRIVQRRIPQSPAQAVQGHLTLHLLFDRAGRLVWQEQDNWMYTRYDYNNRGNIVQIKSRQAADPDIADISMYVYDDKPNPFYTTGQSTNSPMSLGGLAFVLSPNNVVKEVSTDTKGTFQYVSQYAYVYRPDGYPSQVTITRPGDQPFTLRFVYDR